jgi:beta-lactamase regulating signal transducer with metallopeptidase domain
VLDRTGHELLSWLLPVNVATAVLLACALLLDRALARRARASLRIALYAPVALRVLIPLSWTIPAAQVPSLALHIPAEALSARAAQASPAGVPWEVSVAIVYVAVALGLGLRALARRRVLERAIGSARPLGGVEAPCPVLCHDDLGPMVVGLLPPRIVLPQSLVEGASQTALACIAKHEAAHVRRGDPWLVAGMDLLLVVAWPVLPLWIAAARVRHLVELACDEAALEHADAAERRRYGHLLLDVAEHRPLVFSGGGLHFGSTLRARVEAIALQRRWPRAVQLVLVGAAVTGFAACSSMAPGNGPQTTGSTSAASSVDEYGYRYENDPFKANPAVDPVPAERDQHGRLAPEVIQNVVRANFGRFRTCYEQGLKRDAKLEGVVTVKYVILPTGAVRDVADDGSTLPDLDAIQCIVRGFGNLTYPPPEGGYVTVVYPVQFKPGD